MENSMWRYTNQKDDDNLTKVDYLQVFKAAAFKYDIRISEEIANPIWQNESRKNLGEK